VKRGNGRAGTGHGAVPRWVRLRVLKGFDSRALRPHLRHCRCGLTILALSLSSLAAPGAGPSITILTSTQRREVVPVSKGDVQLVPIDEILAGSGVSIAVDASAGSATLQRGGHDVVLHNKKALVSVDGDLRLLSTPVLLEAGRWLVPVDGLPRILPALLENPVQWRAAERVLVIGTVAVPRVTVSVHLSGDMARVVFEASERVPFRVQQEEGRVTVAVPRDLLDVSLPSAQPAGGIVDSVQFLGGRDNVFALKLGPRFRDLKASQQDSPARLVLELHGPPLVTERAAAAPPALHPAAGRPKPQAPEPAVRTIVIDPGHGGEDLGARGPSGTVEKDVALSIARRVRTELVNARGLSVFLTRDRDAELGLDDRTATANNYKADLFVSIHVNASRARGARGSEVYFLSYQASDDESRRIAQAEGSAERLGRTGDGADLALILWDMAQAEHLEESSALASDLQEELAVVTGSEGRGVKQAPFRVLVGATMPAVLVEVAFISNPEEEKLLAAEAYQARVASAIAHGIERYRRERAARLGLPLPPAEPPHSSAP
jgi:N-acetylmuramoyl-L-alanine amidase